MKVMKIKLHLSTELLNNILLLKAVLTESMWFTLYTYMLFELKKQ